MSLELNLDTQQFLAENWQRQPRLFRGAFANFQDLVEPEILAGLALEEGVDSRVIENNNGQWNVSHGPFESYEAFGDEGWTLLVQSVNEWIPEVQQLLAPFRFLPDWRLDDVMISFATEHGGVGPHLDQYDVFIIQGYGKRHWQVGERLHNAVEHCPHPDLKQLQDHFEPVIDAVLEPGDMLYIPAGCPHNGTALEPSLNYSVGFRAPNTAELGAAVADMLSQLEQPLPRYQDPEHDNYGQPFVVTEQQLAHVKNFLLSSLHATDLDHAMMLVLSQSKRPIPQPDALIQADELQQFIGADAPMVIARTPGARILLGPNNTLYANGESWPLNEHTRGFAAAVAEMWNEQPLADYSEVLMRDEAIALCCDLINSGVIDLWQQD